MIINNKIGIKCEVCGESLYIAQRVSTGYFTLEESRPNLGDQVEEFFRDHEARCMWKSVESEEGFDHYKLVYEIGKNPKEDPR